MYSTVQAKRPLNPLAPKTLWLRFWRFQKKPEDSLLIYTVKILDFGENYKLYMYDLRCLDSTSKS